MRKNRLLQHCCLFCAFLWTIFLIPLCYGQITSWTDEDGVRHFSNVEASEEKKTVDVMEEYMTNESDEAVERSRDRFQILRMYEEEREKKEKQEALEKERREAEDKERKQREAEAKAARKIKEACAEHKKELDDLRHTGWEDYETSDLALIACPDRRWKGARGKVYDNMQECTERRDKARKNAYEEAVRKLETEIEAVCSQ